MTPFRIHARCSVISSIKKERLSKPEVIDFFTLLDPNDTEGGIGGKVFQDHVEAYVIANYRLHFVQRLKDETALKHKIGKTLWVVQIHEYTCKPANPYLDLGTDQ